MIYENSAGSALRTFERVYLDETFWHTFYQLVQCYQIPVIQVRFLLLDKLQLFFRIIN